MGRDDRRPRTGPTCETGRWLGAPGGSPGPAEGRGTAGGGGAPAGGGAWVGREPPTRRFEAASASGFRGSSLCSLRVSQVVPLPCGRDCGRTCGPGQCVCGRRCGPAGQPRPPSFMSRGRVLRRRPDVPHAGGPREPRRPCRGQRRRLRERSGPCRDLFAA